MELYTGAPTKSQLSNKRPIYDDYVKINFMRITLDHTEEECESVITSVSYI